MKEYLRGFIQRAASRVAVANAHAADGDVLYGVVVLQKTKVKQGFITRICIYLHPSPHSGK